MKRSTDLRFKAPSIWQAKDDGMPDKTVQIIERELPRTTVTQTTGCSTVRAPVANFSVVSISLEPRGAAESHYH